MFTVHKLQRAQADPEPNHFEAAERAFRYQPSLNAYGLVGGTLSFVLSLMMQISAQTELMGNRFLATSMFFFFGMLLHCGPSGFKELLPLLLWRLSI